MSRNSPSHHSAFFRRLALLGDGKPVLMVDSRDAWLAAFGEELVADGAVSDGAGRTWSIARCVVQVRDDCESGVVSGRVFQEPDETLLPRPRALQFHYQLNEDEPDVAAADVARWISRAAT